MAGTLFLYGFRIPVKNGPFVPGEEAKERDDAWWRLAIHFWMVGE